MMLCPLEADLAQSSMAWFRRVEGLLTQFLVVSWFSAGHENLQGVKKNCAKKQSRKIQPPLEYLTFQFTINIEIHSDRSKSWMIINSVGQITFTFHTFIKSMVFSISFIYSSPHTKTDIRKMSNRRLEEVFSILNP